jgi:CPA1 family monovalent cation:H+ antiporter
MISPFALLSILVTVGALFSLLSYRALRLPTTIGTMILSLCAAAVLIGAGNLGGASAHLLHTSAERLVAGINFNQAVLHGMLAFLLFAGALQLDIEQLYRERAVVLALSIGATALSTAIVAVLFKGALALIGLPLSTSSALLFGALISPTDPIAVLEMLRRVGAPAHLEVQLAGESLFNDGVGAVIFLALLGATGAGGGASSSMGSSAGAFAALLLLKAGGAIALGLVLGYLTFRVLSLVDSYRVEVLLTLALAMGGYALADALKLSAPLEAVTAGLMVSGRARALVMSPQTRDHLEKFWELIDDILNVVLFLLLGMQLLVLPIARGYVVAGLIAIPVVLLARLVSVTATLEALAIVRGRVPGAVMVLTWGGLRGALAVALALSLPVEYGHERNLLLIATYIVVVFSIVVQGLTIPRLLQWLGSRQRLAA